MIGGDVAHEGAGDFVVAHAAVQPAQEDDELHRDRNKRCEPAHAGTPAGARNENWNRLERPSRGIDGHSERRKLWTMCYALFADGRVSSRCEKVSLDPSCDAGIPCWLWCPANSCSRSRLI